MSWVMLSDTFGDECALLSDVAFRTHVEALAWVMRRERGPFIAHRDLARFAESSDALTIAVPELVNHGTWDVAPGGWYVRHHMEHQLEPAVIAKRRADTAERKRRERARKVGLTTVTPAPDVTRDIGREAGSASDVTRDVTRDRGREQGHAPRVTRDVTRDRSRDPGREGKGKGSATGGTAQNGRGDDVVVVEWPEVAEHLRTSDVTSTPFAYAADAPGETSATAAPFPPAVDARRTPGPPAPATRQANAGSGPR